MRSASLSSPFAWLAALTLAAAGSGCSLLLDWDSVGAGQGDAATGVGDASPGPADAGSSGLDVGPGGEDAGEPADASGPGLDAGYCTTSGDCPGGQECDNNACCTPKTDLALCAELSYQCGVPTFADDGCGYPRTAASACGTCFTGTSCNGATFQCEATCTPETDAELCARHCGVTSVMDKCGGSKTLDCPCACSASGATAEIFKDSSGNTVMVGCKGSVDFVLRNTLCAAGWTACSPRQVVSRLDGVSPGYHYWTSQNLGPFGTGSNACAAASRASSAVPSVDTVTCASHPMRVCTTNGIDNGSAVIDRAGNACGMWTGCNLVDIDASVSSAKVFGGCAYVGSSPNLGSVASTLCCPKVAVEAVCASSGAAARQDYGDNFMFGCGHTKTFAEAQSFCPASAPACRTCRIDEWLGRPDAFTPQFNMFLAESLKTSGSSGNCSSSVDASGGANPARLCVAGGADALGTTCLDAGSATDCGYSAVSPNEFVGGYNSTSKAGVLCCCP